MIINIKNLTFSYDGSFFNIFNNVNLSLDTSWRLGLVGRNGKGKTTLLKILFGKLEYSGKIETSVNFEYFPFLVDKTKTISEIFCSVCPKIEMWKVQRELNLLEIELSVLQRQFLTLSLGEQTKVMLAILFAKENSFLLIDEPTTYLDILGRKKLSEYLSQKNGFIIVSHDRNFLDGCVNHILSINKASLEIQKGNFSSFLLNKELEDNFEMAENEKLKGEISRLEESSKKSRGWAMKNESTKIGFDPSITEKSIVRRVLIGAKTKKKMKQVKALEKRNEKAIAEKEKLLKNIDISEDLCLRNLNFGGEVFLTIKDLVISYDNKQINNPISFEVKKGDRINLMGKNGCGKSSVIKAILGQIDGFSGKILLPTRLKISYVSQDTSHLKGNLQDFCSENKIDRSKFMIILDKLGFEENNFDGLIQNFSDGQKKKLLIAKSLCEESNLLIWDEPLNYIDIISREQIEKLILTYKPTMIFVEHDKFFCDLVATKNIIM
ncbi:MAG: ABC-F type ribosomal protection protein [Clostridia bacterium]